MRLSRTPGIPVFVLVALSLVVVGETYAESSDIPDMAEKRDVVITRTFDAPVE